MTRRPTTHETTAPTELDGFPEGSVVRLATGALIEKTGVAGTGWEALDHVGQVRYDQVGPGAQVLYVPSSPPPALGEYLDEVALRALPAGSVVLGSQNTVLSTNGADKWYGIEITEDGSPIDTVDLLARYAPVKLLHLGGS